VIYESYVDDLIVRAFSMIVVKKIEMSRGH
jgi:hypothetical protein